MNNPDTPSASPPHAGPIEIVDTTASTQGALTVRFVRYPDCQQLQLWLPVPDLQGHRRLQVRRDDGLLVEDTTVRQCLSGSVQMLFDTLPWPPGRYRLQIGDDGDAQALSLTFVKHASDADLAPPPAPAPSTEPSAPIRYRDGFGRLIPDADLELREAVIGSLMRRLSRRVHLLQRGLSCVVVYEEALPQPRRITFSHERGTAPGRWQLPVPAPGRWVAETGFTLAERDEVLQFVAEQLLSQQLPGWGCSVRDEIIDFRQRRMPGR